MIAHGCSGAFPFMAHLTVRGWRESEHKRAVSVADKAAKAEQDAEAAEAEAQTRLDEAHKELEGKSEQVRDAGRGKAAGCGLRARSFIIEFET